MKFRNKVGPPELIVIAGCLLFSFGFAMCWIPGGVMSLGLFSIWLGLRLAKDERN